MSVSRLLRNAKFVDIALALTIGSLGFFINAIYFSFEYLERSGNILALAWAEPVEHTLVMATMPLYIAIGSLYLHEKRTKRELELSNKLKDLFTDVLRHDLLNSVGVIQTSVELLEDNTEDREITAMIKRHISRLEDTIDNASKLARVEAQEKLNLEDSDLSEYVRTAIEEMKPLAQEKRIELKEEFEGRYPAKCNPIFREVLINLISNAIKYGPTDSKVSIGIEDDGNAWRIMVKDNGPGILDEHKEDIFHRFVRKEKGGTKGSGLGLAIVQGIVALHKGRVWVEDNKPRGSIFYVKLPKEE